MTKLVLKCGDIEIDYDGPEAFLTQELPQLLKAVAELRSQMPPAPAAGTPAGVAGVVQGATAGGTPSVSTIAQKLSVKTGPELIIASALSFVLQGRTTFAKKDLRERMREAPTFFKAGYATNFDKTVARLTRTGRLHHNSGTTYSLPEEEKNTLTARLQ